MASRLPYIAPIRISLGISSEGSGQYQNSENQQFEIHQILQESDGTFDIINISNNAAKQFSPASNSNPLSGNVFPDMDNDTDSLRNLPIPLTLEGQEILKFTLLDTSGVANVVNIALVGILIEP